MNSRQWLLKIRRFYGERRIRGFVQGHRLAINYVLAAALLFGYSINEGARANFKDRENQAMNAIKMFNLQQSMGNLDELVSKWSEVDGLAQPSHFGWFLGLKKYFSGLSGSARRYFF
ncbi:hypothetical protein [Ferrovum sp.]|uniref:hypothetical protein n=1 Tax=Ferrovum sp. TaxID=2609467 RepID=UPI002616E426|nr:hypothetical protein [Ferrovum sp.]